MARDNVIQSTPNAVDTVADDRAQHRAGNHRYGEVVASDVAVLIRFPDHPNDLVRVHVGVAPQLVLDVFEVVIRPFELDPPGVGFVDSEGDRA